MAASASDRPARKSAPDSAPVPLGGILLAVAGACFFSTKSVFIKLAYAYEVDVAPLMTLRMGFALPFYLFFAWMAVRERRQQGRTFDLSGHALAKTALLGMLGYYCATYLDLMGLTLITAQFERLILFTYPVFVVLMGAMFLGQYVGKRVVLSLIISYLGLMVIFGQDMKLFGSDVTKGVAYVVAAAITYAGFILFSQFEIKKLGSRLFTSLAMIAASAAILIHFALLHDLSALVLPLPAYGLALLIAVVSTVIPSFMLTAAIERIGPGPTSTLSGFGPVFTAILGVSLLGEPFTLWHLTGMSLVICGALILSQRSNS